MASIVETRSCAALPIISSGGIHTSMDIIKSLALGASAAGLAGAFIRILTENGLAALIDEIELLKSELKLIMTALGAQTVDDLLSSPLIICGQTHHWLYTRGFNPDEYARRSLNTFRN
ncbi:hypothetical protein KP78_31780 [Jeotgalibacillus soli]|uniref:FMN-dependent dehydrogenase domain-containing protein n=1 Tax=Jeotgalibacillus soli TaxID=889306 RepID=A0A0C2RR34_9BACL|nr:hypothetical protein KP78_31780 [Jeotgalibacillus soli]